MKNIVKQILILLVCVPIYIIGFIFIYKIKVPTPYEDYNWDRFSETTTATITNLNTVSSIVTELSKDNTLVPTYEYTVNHINYSCTSQSYNLYNIGDTVEILYDPDIPNESILYIPDEVLYDKTSEFKIAMLTIFTLIFLVPIVIYIINKIRSKKSNN